MDSSATISLREWIKSALKCSENGVSVGGSYCGDHALSWDYLLASLEIAISLSEDINNAEDLARIGFSDGLNVLPHSSNDSIPDWAEFVTVRLNDDQRGIGVGNEEQEEQCTKSNCPIDLKHSTFADPGLSSKSGFDGCQFQDLSDDFSDHYDESLALPSIEAVSVVEKLVQSQDKRSYLNIHSANIATTVKDGEDCEDIVCSDSVRDKQQRIYFLGLVFYELFSGGDRPPPELSVDPPVFAKPNNAAAKKASASHALDFTTKLQVVDDSVPDVDCDILSDLNRDHDVLFSEERLAQDMEKSSNCGECRKRQATVHHALGYSEHKQGEMAKGAVLCKITAQVSLEQLKLKGIPGPLCSMIYNMMDCINGDFSGDESYSNVSDVTSDLRLMLEYPEKFLRDLDINELTLTPQTLNETVFVRNDEFASLQCAYRNSVSGSPEIALIAGESGIGKSWLADRLGKFIVSNGGVFLEGKFDRLHRAQPLAVLARALNAYCDKLIREADSERKELIASKLEEALGCDGCQLVKVIPALGDIIVCDEIDSNSDATQDCMQNRLYYLMRRFVETISSFSDGIIALFLDDLQWADDVSISIVGEILKSSDASTRFFFLGCYRDDEIENGHPFWKMIESVQGLGVAASIVKLKCMDKDMVTKVLSYLLCLPPRLVRSLSDIIYHKTKGNPLFFSQFILSLNRDGLLYLSLIHRRWEWDEEQILSRRLPDDVALLLEQRIGKLPPDVKFALHTLSCFGATIDVDVIKELESNLGDRLIDPLALAEEEGFVTKLNAKYFFCHDRIQEAAYCMTTEDERCLHHMKYGLSLAELSLNGDDNDRMLFVAVGQMNLGGPSAVSNDDERMKIVKYNLAAGKIAVGMSEFHSAFNFFDNSISFLKKTHWRDHFDLSLELYELAAECALITGDVLSLTVLTEQVMKNACSFEDTLNISYICMSPLCYASKIADSVEMGLDILAKLGEELPRSFSDEYIELQIKTTRAILDKISLTDLLTYKIMTDKKKMMAMKFLRRLKEVAEQVNPNLVPIITLKMINITIKYGMSPMSPVGFAYFGSLVANLGDIKGGYKFTRLAKSLIDRLKLREIAGQVFYVSVRH